MAQLRRRRPDLEVVDIRGNVDTRLGKVDERRVWMPCSSPPPDSAASAAPRWSPTTSTSTRWPTAPGQGALAIEVRRGEEDLVRALDHAETRAAVEAERHVLALLEAGCSAPVGAHAVVDAGLLLLSASVYSLDGATALTSSHATDVARGRGRPAARGRGIRRP